MSVFSNLAGKVCLVTGAASGIGKGVAEKFLRHGANVAVTDLAGPGAKAVAEELTAEFATQGNRAEGFGLDVTSESSVQESVDAVAQEFGAIDVLVANAGIQYISKMEDLTLEQWRRVTGVHLDGSFLTTRAVYRQMLARNEREGKKVGGSLVYIGSGHSKVASALKAPYVSAKHGMAGLCRVMAKEGAEHNIKANLVCPGYVLTPLVAKQIPEQAQEFGISEEEVVKKIFLKDTVDGEFSTIEDVADTVAFFAAFPNKALTGQSLLVSHGAFGME